jgi:hypothetical protein
MAGNELVVQEERSVSITENSVAMTVNNVQMAEKMVSEVLEKDIDYGQTPGTQGMGLWDAGASKIMAAYNCYPEHHVLEHTEEEDLIAWCIQVSLINRNTGAVIGSGIGSASTRETKYKYRWVYDPENYGYGTDEIKKLKTRSSGKSLQYRVLNAEVGELSNTLFQMASKRAEVDASRGMPGVASALKKLFAGGITHEEPAGQDIDWSGFWGECNRMGLDEPTVHELLGVKSVNDWVTTGGTKKGALVFIQRKLDQRRSNPAGEKIVWTKDNLKNVNDLLRACNMDFGLQPASVYREAGYATRKAFEDNVRDYWETYQAIKEIHKTEEEKPS